MRKAFSTLAPVLAAGLILPGCIILDGPGVEGSGNRARQERELEPFSRIRLVGAEDVVVRVGEPQSVVVEGDDNLIDMVETEVRGETLTVKTEGSYRTRIGLTLDVRVPELEGVSVAGSGDVQVTGVDAESFSASIAGSGDVTVSGKVGDLEAEIAGSGDLHLYDLRAERARAEIAGSGDIRIWASQSLRARIAGSGDIAYRGDPPEVDRSVTGSGSIRAD